MAKAPLHLTHRVTVNESVLSVSADVSIFAYAHVAPEAGLELGPYPNVGAWLERIETVPGFMNDLAPYPDNARAGQSRSIYDD